jgi:hypothetical protein
MTYFFIRSIDVKSLILSLFQGPLAIKMAKKAVNQGGEVDMSTALSVEEECYEQVLHTQFHK